MVTMESNTFRANTDFRITATTSTGASCGKVTSRNTRQLVAPSMRAASCVSGGIEARPPISMKVKYGAQCQTSAEISAAVGRVGLAR